MTTRMNDQDRSGSICLRATLACAAIGIGGLAGCSTDLNSRATLGASRALPTLAGDSGPADSVQQPAREAATRLDRGDWAAVEFRVPVDGTVHAPTWKTEPSFSDAHHRAYGLFPTTESALDLGSDPAASAISGFVEPGRALLDLAMLPIRAVFSPAWAKTQSPAMYKRWHSDAWLAGPAPEAQP